MKRLLVICCLLICAAPAHAMPSAQQVTSAGEDAHTYWRTGEPRCGTPTFQRAQQTLPEDAAGAAYEDTCLIEYSRNIDWRLYPVEFCQVIVHEWGHLMLGATYFAATNPLDSAHSADPHNIMFPSGGDTPRVCRRHAPVWRHERRRARVPPRRRTRAPCVASRRGEGTGTVGGRCSPGSRPAQRRHR